MLGGKSNRIFIEAIALLPLGYPAKVADPERHSNMRKEIKDIVHWGKW